MDNKERDTIISELLAEGKGLSEVQKILESEHGLKITYMDLRLIATDLEVNWKKIDEVNNPAPDEDDADADETKQEVETLEATLEGETVVNISKLVRPGAIFSGDVTFKSGIKAEWYLDQAGRLGLNPDVDGQEPSEEDLMDFQLKLQEALQSRGL